MSRRRATARPEYGLSSEALRQQLIKANDRVSLLEARTAALKSRLGHYPDPLLVEIAQALTLANFIAHPQQAHSYDDPAGIKRTTEPHMPGASTARQRRAARHLRSQLEKAVHEFDSARQRDWQPVDKVPTIRCRNRHCSRQDRRVAAWNHEGKPNEFCPGCGNRYHEIDEP